MEVWWLGFAAGGDDAFAAGLFVGAFAAYLGSRRDK